MSLFCFILTLATVCPSIIASRSQSPSFLSFPSYLHDHIASFLPPSTILDLSLAHSSLRNLSYRVFTHRLLHHPYFAYRLLNSFLSHHAELPFSTNQRPINSLEASLERVLSEVRRRNGMSTLQWNRVLVNYEGSKWRKGIELVRSYHPSISPETEDVIRRLRSEVEKFRKGGYVPDSILLDYSNNNGEDTMLMVAVKRGLKEWVDRLVRDGADPDRRVGRVSVLEVAVMQCHVDIVGRLVEVGARIGATDVHKGVLAKCPGVVRILLESGADVDAWDEVKWSPVQYAAYSDDSRALEVVLAFRPRFDKISPDTMHPLHLAAKQGRTRNIALLINYGVFVDDPDRNGYTSLFYSVANNHYDTSRWLLQHGANARAQTPINLMPIHVVKSPALAYLLIQHNVNVTATLNGSHYPLYAPGDTVLHVLLSHPNEQAYHCLSLLLLYFPTFDVVNEAGDTPFHRVMKARWYQYGLVESVIGLEPDVNRADSEGMRPIHRAVMHPTHPVEMVVALLKHGVVDVNAETTRGERETAMHLVMRRLSAARGDDERRLVLMVVVQTMMAAGGSMFSPNAHNLMPIEMYLTASN